MNSVMIAMACLFPVLITPSEPESSGSDPDDVLVVSGMDNDDGWIGVSIQDMTPRLAKSMGVETKEGALVNDVVGESPAEAAGIEDQDVIVAFDGHDISDADDLVREVRNLKPETKVDVVLMRGNEKKSLEVTVGTSPHRQRVAAIRAPHWGFNTLCGSDALGMQLQDLSDQLAGFFGAPENEGVLVTEVRKETPAAKAGFKAGDVILRVENQTIREPDDVMDEVEEYKKGDNVKFEILRDKAKKSLTMEIEETQNMYWFRSPQSEFNHQFHWDHNFNFDFDEDHWKDFEEELQEKLDELNPELDRIRIRLKELGREIREEGLKLRERLDREVRPVNG